MSALTVILLTLVGLAALEPTERQSARSEARSGRIRERLTLLRQLGLISH